MRGCLRDRERSREAEVERIVNGGVDFGRISHSGSWLSICALQVLASVGVVRPMMMVMDSLSESKLWIEVGVSAGCCGLRLGDSLYWRVTLVDGGLLLLSTAVLKV